MLVVCPNPTIDRQVFVDALVPGSVSRSRRNRALPGGKPVDVLRAMLAHDCHPPLHVLLPDQNEGWVERLADEGIPAHAFGTAGRVRETIVVYEDDGRATVINGQGHTVAPQAWRAFTGHVVGIAGPREWVVVSGSFPPGVDDDAVATFVDDLHAAGARVALDTGPRWLAAALPARPDLVTPNLAEAEQALTGTPATESVDVATDAAERARRAAEALAARGITHAVVTAGTQGTAWATADASGVVPAVLVEAVNPIGAGDAFLGGLMARLDRDEPFADAVAWGVVTASSAVTQWIPGRADAAQVAELRERLP